jgi:hypothetical protein
MTVMVRERRGTLRIAAAYPVVIRDRRGRVIAKGRTANISQSGIYLILPARNEIKPGASFNLELSLPGVDSRGRLGANRTVNYRGRVVRTDTLGQLLGVGIELVRKLS